MTVATRGTSAMTAATPNRDAGRREGNNNEVMKCFCWKKRLKRTGRRLSWEGGGGKTARGGGGGDSGGGTGGHAQSQPRKKSNEASFTSSCSSSVPVVSPTGVIAIAAVVLIGKPTKPTPNILTQSVKQPDPAHHHIRWCAGKVSSSIESRSIQ